MENRIQKLCSIPLLLFPAFRPLDHGTALKIERKMSDLIIAFDRYVSIGTVMHYILVISIPDYRYKKNLTPIWLRSVNIFSVIFIK